MGTSWRWEICVNPWVNPRHPWICPWALWCKASLRRCAQSTPKPATKRAENIQHSGWPILPAGAALENRLHMFDFWWNKDIVYIYTIYILLYFDKTLHVMYLRIPRVSWIYHDMPRHVVVCHANCRTISFQRHGLFVTRAERNLD